MRQCLTVITSFRAVDILGLSSPVILRKLNLAAIPYRGSFNTHGDKAKIVWHPATVLGNNSKTRTCGKFFDTTYPTDRIYDARSYCTELLTGLFASSSKPWECDIEMTLFPPNYSKRVPNISSFYRFNKLEYPTALEYYTRAPVVTRLSILIDEILLKEYDEFLCKQTLYGLKNMHGFTYKMNLELPWKFYKVLLASSNHRPDINSLHTVWTYENCKASSEISINEFSETVVNLAKPLHLSEETILWKIYVRPKQGLMNRSLKR